MSRTLPLLCAAPVVRAILSGAQSQDRRPIPALRPLADGSPSYPQYTVREVVSESKWSRKEQRKVSRDFLHVHNGSCDGAGWWLPAPWSVGDTLYVRETWNVRGACWSLPISASKAASPDAFVYAATPPEGWGGGWRPSMHMPKWAARIHLRIAAVRVERVGEISEADARAEGVEADDIVPNTHAYRDAFARLWDSIYPATPFDSWPWVWVTTFERVRP